MKTDRPLVGAETLDELIDWLLEQGLTDVSLAEVLGRIGPTFSRVGLPVDRVGVGTLLLHPVLGAHDIQWDALSGTVTEDNTRREVLKAVAAEGPYTRAVRDADPFRSYDLGPDAPEPEYPVLARLRSSGFTEYTVSYLDFGRRDSAPWTGVPHFREGILISFATRQKDGFRSAERTALRRLVRPVGVVAKGKTRRTLTRILMTTYLGGLAGEKVLSGKIERGDHVPITCAIWLCDLKGSTALAERMSVDEYLAVLNAYFDITVGAVSRHGGEVLKFIGDAVMAIFPIDGDGRSTSEAAQAALSAAREALADAASVNAERIAAGEPEIGFRIGLHVGDVVFGNVGSADRLDFTVIGAAVNRASRLIGLCKRLETPVIASGEFASEAEEALACVGTHAVAGVVDPIEAFALAEPALRP